LKAAFPFFVVVDVVWLPFFISKSKKEPKSSASKRAMKLDAITEVPTKDCESFAPNAACFVQCARHYQPDRVSKTQPGSASLIPNVGKN